MSDSVQILGMIALTAFHDGDWATMRDDASFHRGGGIELVHELHTAIIRCRLFCGQNEVLNEVYLMMLMVEGSVLEMTRGDLSMFPAPHISLDEQTYFQLMRSADTVTRACQLETARRI
jgi:hypothetical protein